MGDESTQKWVEGEEEEKEKLDINRGVDEGGRHFTPHVSLTGVYLGSSKDRRAP